jgi:hypothetical protein
MICLYNYYSLFCHQSYIDRYNDWLSHPSDNSSLFQCNCYLEFNFILGVQVIYRVIKKSLCTWWLQYRKLKVMFKVSAASHQTFIDTPNCVLEDRVQYSTVHILNVFLLMAIIKSSVVWGLFEYTEFFVASQVHRDVLITLYLKLFQSLTMIA